MTLGWRGLCVAVGVAACVTSAPAQAQVRDTTRVRADTLAADTLGVQPEDTVRVPPPRFVRLPGADTVPDAARAIWRWDRDELLRAATFTLADLLASVPGVMAYRSGLGLQPEAAGALGGAGGRIEIFRDGFPIDALDEAAFDLSRISLIEVEEVTVERRPDVVRVHLVTTAPVDARAYSRVEAGVGEPELQLFRGLFLTPHFIVGPLSLAVERIDTDGEGRREPADGFAGWAKWGWLREDRGVQFEVWQNSINREPNVPWPTKHVRRDLLLRARNRFADGLVAEAYAAQSNIEETSLAPLPDGDTLGAPVFDRSSRQYGLRAAFERGPLLLEGAARTRSAESLPSFEVEAAGRTRLLGSRLGAGGGLTYASWRDADATLAVRGHVDFRPVGFVRAFAEMTGGVRGVARFPDALAPSDTAPPVDPDFTPIRSDLTSLRLGAELQRDRLQLAGALIDHSVDSVAVFALPFDTVARALPGGEGRAWEVWGRADLARFWGGSLYLEGSWLTWFDGTPWVYRPADRGIVSAGIHIVPLQSGNLEVRGRLWVDRRGETAYPARDESGAPTIATLASRALVHADLFIRIIDVRIFARFEDWRGEGINDIPGRTIRGPRIFYGVKWHFWN